MTDIRKEFDSSGGQQQAYYATTKGCKKSNVSFSVGEEYDWISASKAGDGVVNINVTANDSTDSRTGYVYVLLGNNACGEIIIHQEGGDSPQPGDCNCGDITLSDDQQPESCNCDDITLNDEQPEEECNCGDITLSDEQQEDCCNGIIIRDNSEDKCNCNGIVIREKSHS